MHDWAMLGGLALLSALPERFTAFAFADSLLLRWMLAHIRNDGLHLSPARDAAGSHTLQRLSVLLPERFDSGWGSAPSAVQGSFKLQALSPDVGDSSGGQGACTTAISGFWGFRAQIAGIGPVRSSCLGIQGWRLGEFNLLAWKHQLIGLLEAGCHGLALAHAGLELPELERAHDGIHDAGIGIGRLIGHTAELTLSRDFQAEDHRGFQPVRKPVGADGGRGVAAWPGLLIELGGGCAICIDPGGPFHALWTLWRCRRCRCQFRLWGNRLRCVGTRKRLGLAVIRKAGAGTEQQAEQRSGGKVWGARKVHDRIVGHVGSAFRVAPDAGPVPCCRPRRRRATRPSPHAERPGPGARPSWVWRSLCRAACPDSEFVRRDPTRHAWRG